MPEILNIASAFLISMILAVLTIPVVIKVSNQLNLFAIPNERSATVYSTPTLGGISVFLSFILGVTLTLDRYIVPGTIYFISSLMIMFFVGLKDDIVSMRAKHKLGFEIIVASILIFFGQFRFTSLHGFLGIETIPLVPGALLTVFVCIVIINAFNLVDGIDGLAAGLGIFSASVLGSWFFLTGHINSSIIAFSLTGGLVGFFYYNVFGKKYKIFMGDTGSLVLGTIMAVLVIQFNEFNIDQSADFAVSASPAVSFGLLIYPLLDTIRVFFIRIAQKKSPFSADKNHTHHRLLAIGLKHRHATYLILTVNALFSLTVWNLAWIGMYGLMTFNILVGLGLMVLPGYIIRRRNLIGKDDPHQKVVFFRVK